MLDNNLIYINWEKINGLIPCIIQNIYSSEVLMLGYMNAEALQKTQKYKKVTFYSRTKKKIWVKGETSGNFLHVVNIKLDCDQDSLLILVNPIGSTCHLKNHSCFNDIRPYYTNFFYLEKKIKKNKNINCNDSYTASLYKHGINKIVQKFGEESVEVIVSALNKNKLDLVNESADLLYHLLILLHYYNLDFNIIMNILYDRQFK